MGDFFTFLLFLISCVFIIFILLVISVNFSFKKTTFTTKNPELGPLKKILEKALVMRKLGKYIELERMEANSRDTKFDNIGITRTP